MLRKTTYKSRESKLKTSFNLLFVFILLSFITTGCIKKEKINVQDPLLVKLLYPKTVEQGTLTDIKVQVTNRGLYPIAVTNIQVAQPRTTVNFKGMTPLKALRHKFIKGKKFKRTFYLDKKFAGREEHVVPEVHKLEKIVYPGKTNIYIVKAIAQNIKGNIYKNNISVFYINFDQNWNEKIYLFVGQTSPRNKTLVDELYNISKKIPSKLTGNLVASIDLGKVKHKNFNIKMNLLGWNLKNKKLNPEEYIFFKKRNAWLHCNGADSFWEYKDGKTQEIKNVNMVRPFIKAIIKGKINKVYIKNTDFKDLKEEVNKYNFTLVDDYFEGSITLEQLNDFFDKIYSKGYGIHKHGELIKGK